nr:guanine nucleotide-binding protein subunit alpha [Polyrhizophydium stewartii]
MLTKEKTESTIRIFELESQVACHVRRSDIARGAELVGYSIETMVEPDTSDVAGGQLPGQPAMLPPLSATLDAKISAEIDKQIEKDRQAMIKAQEEPRLLILGSSDSGKTTLLKQLKILHGGGFIDAEKDQYRIQMAANCLDSIKTLISGVDKLAIPVDDHDAKQACGREAEIMRFELPKSDTAAVPQNIVGAIEQTWASAHIQAAWKQANKLQVQDTADLVRTVLDPEYKLTNEVTEFRFTVGSTMFHFFDVGGMIHQRKQWISYFDNVDLLVFIASLASYD